jgi:hypothetical protein
MTGTLAQIIALTAFGNDFLKNGTIPTDFNSANTTFQFCNKVDFREFKKLFFFLKPKETVIANNPTEWFQYLKSDGCKHLRLYFEYSKAQSFAKDHKLAGLVGGGGSWLIEAVYDNHSNYWANRWEVTNQNALDNKIWTVNYGMTVKKQHISNLQIDNQKIKEKLRQTLSEIADFAFRQDLKSWGEQFDKAKLTLDSLTPENSYYHTDLIPVDKYSLIAKQIIFSAGSAWVFGGMGSWNDLGFDSKEDNETYDRLSEQLYSNINEAIIAGTNTY